MKDKLFRKGLAGVIILLFIGAGIIPSTVGIYEKKQSPKDDKTSFMGFNPRGDILYVGGSGPNNYTHIQDAIDAASNGDTVFVYDYSSPYYENVAVDKSINLIGENIETTVIDGSETGDVVHISSDWVNISGFTIQNSGVHAYPDYGYYAGVRISYSRVQDGHVYYQSDNNTVSGCKIVNNQVGIGIVETDNNQIVMNELVSDEYGSGGDIRCGILIHGSNSNNNLVQKNTINHYRSGISTCHWSGCGNNTSIIENEIINSLGGISVGSNDNIVQENTVVDAGIGISGDDNQVIGNEISANSDVCYGLSLGGCDNIIQDNYIHDAGTVGINIQCHSDNNYFINNTVSNCHEGIWMEKSNESYFENNTFSNIGYSDIAIYDHFYDTTLLNNVMENGINIWYDIERLTFDPTYHGGVDGNIVTGNTVNGEPLIYKEDESYITIDSETAGQVILVNCDNVTVDDMDLSDTLVGLELIDSKDCVVSNNTFSNNIFYGILLLNSHYNMIQDNTLSDMPDDDWVAPKPISLEYSSNNTLRNNQLSDNVNGILVQDYSCNNQIKSNTISTAGGIMEGFGIFLKEERSDNTNISYNTISDCYKGVCICTPKGGWVLNTTIYMNTFENCYYDFSDNSYPPQTQMSSLSNVKTLSYEDNPTRILKNNFMGLNLFTMFMVKDPSTSFTTWQNNYWGRFRILPKLLIGVDTGGKLAQLKIDWHPARKPYEI